MVERFILMYFSRDTEDGKNPCYCNTSVDLPVFCALAVSPFFVIIYRTEENVVKGTIITLCGILQFYLGAGGDFY